MSDFDGHHDSNTINITNYHQRIFDIKQTNVKKYWKIDDIWNRIARIVINNFYRFELIWYTKLECIWGDVAFCNQKGLSLIQFIFTIKLSNSPIISVFKSFTFSTLQKTSLPQSLWVTVQPMTHSPIHPSTYILYIEQKEINSLY